MSKQGIMMDFQHQAHHLHEYSWVPTQVIIGPYKLTFPPTLYMMPECLS